MSESDVEFTDRVIAGSRAMADRLTIGGEVPPRPNFPVIRTLAELTALPDGATIATRTQILTRGDEAFDHWLSPGDQMPDATHADMLPALLIWHPSWESS